MDDLMYVNVRAVVNTQIYKFSKEEFQMMQDKHSNIAKNILMFQNQMLRSDRIYPIDVE